MKLLVGSIVVAILAGVVAYLLVCVYVLKSDHPFVRAVGYSFPAARVEGRSVSYGAYLAHVDAQKVFLNGPMAVDSGAVRDITDSERKEALERAIRIEAVEGLAVESGVEVTPLDVDRAFDELVARAGASTTVEEVRAFLNSQFGWDESEYKQYLLRPAYVEEILRSRGGDTFDATLQARIDGADRYLKF